MTVMTREDDERALLMVTMRKAGHPVSEVAARMNISRSSASKQTNRVKDADADHDPSATDYYW